VNTIRLNDGTLAEYIPNLQPGDKLRARGKILSQGCCGDWVYDYTAFEPGQACVVDHVTDWGGTSVGFVRDGDNTCWLALTNQFERVA
jgi:hypothetical protein